MLETERLLLRPVNQDDLDDLFRIYGDPATNTFNPTGPYQDISYAKNVLKKWMQHWHDYAFGDWAIAEKDSPGHTIGFVVLGGLAYEVLKVLPSTTLDIDLKKRLGEEVTQQSLHAFWLIMGLVSLIFRKYPPP